MPSPRRPRPAAYPASPADGTALLQRRYASLRRFAQTCSGHLDPDEATELVHEAWLRLAARRRLQPAGTAVEPPLAYLQQIIRRLVIDRHRQQQRRRELGAEVLAQLPSPAPSPFQLAAGQQACAVLEQAIQRLPPRCRRVFLLYRRRQLSVRTIATQLALSPKTVENQIACASHRCRRYLHQRGFGD